MNLDKVLQSNDLLEFSFFVLIDMFKEIHCGENLANLKEKIIQYYKGDFPKLNNKEVSAKEFTDYLESLTEENLEKVEIKIKKPNYAENTLIISNSTTIDVGTGLPVLNNIEYYKQRILRLLKDWNLESNGKKAPIDIVTVGSLHPSIADYITSIINDNVPHYINSVMQ